MAKDSFSFDVVSEVDLQEVKNAFDQANREIITRFDFKNTGTSLSMDEDLIEIRSDTDHRLKAAVEVLKEKLVRRELKKEILTRGAWSTVLFLYARLVGRYTRLLGRVRLKAAPPKSAEPKKERPRKKKKRARVQDPWAVPEEEPTLVPLAVTPPAAGLVEALLPPPQPASASAATVTSIHPTVRRESNMGLFPPR